MVKIAPSLLAADFWNLGQQVEQVVAAGAEVLHIDVMDGHFVPNLTMGPVVVKGLRAKTQATLDVHLMVEKPDNFIEPFAEAGADWISFHIEAGPHPHRTCQKIKAAGCKAGIVLNPGTSLASIEAMLPEVDFVLLMSVNPGFGGQSFIQSSIVRLEQLVQMTQSLPNPPFVEMDGGIGTGNIGRLARSGMQVAVAGSSVFGQADPGDAVKALLAEARG